mmetsp:Transcript_18465/g.34497  ORF Transcript_18465/g.34497 Transcript_18465/m.34497 type:complete len:1217 (+) Transcript_18465:46-3696(+)
MRYIDQWLSGLGLDHVIPLLQTHGITTPKKLALLTLRDIYEVVGVEDAEDRKKLYFLIQRLQSILKKEKGTDDNNDQDDSADMDHGGSGRQSTGKRQISKSPPRSPPRSPNKMNSSKSTPPLSPTSRHSDEKPVQYPRASFVDVSPLRQPNRRTKEQVPRPSYSRDNHEPDSGEEETSLQSESTDSVHSHQNSPPSQVRDDLKLLRRQHRQSTSVSRESLTSNNAHVSPERDPSPVGNSSNGFDNGIGNPPETVLNARHTSPIVPPKAVPVKMKMSSAGPAAQTGSTHHSTQRGGVAGKNTTSTSSRNKRTPATLSVPSPPPSPPPTSPYSTARSREQMLTAHARSKSRSPPPPISNSRSRDTMITARARSKSRSPPPPTTRAHKQHSLSPSPGHRPHHSHHSRKSHHADHSHKSHHADRSPPAQRSPVRPVERPSVSNSNLESISFSEVDMAIRVVVRKRPISRTEQGKNEIDVLEVFPRGKVLVHEPKTKVDLTKFIETQEFIFDDAFDFYSTNEEIYRRVMRSLVATMFEGGKGSCFAYGQTGSGKTFTMMGSNPAAPAEARENAGLYVLAARDIFQLLDDRQSKCQLMVSCFEIYGGKLFDLLNGRSPIKCLEDSKQRVQLPGLSEHGVRNVHELLKMMSQAHDQRSTGSTGANMESSRSHQVLQLQLVEDRVLKSGKIVKKPCGKLSFIDLAGSERGADTSNNSKQTRMEGAEINTSLLALKEVIRSLEKKHGHTPFRGSKLTQVLKDSFIGENTKTCMVACVSPSMSNCEHTLNTLRYADRVKEHQQSNDSDERVMRPSSAIPSSNADINVASQGIRQLNLDTNVMVSDKNVRPSTSGGSSHYREEVNMEDLTLMSQNVKQTKKRSSLLQAPRETSRQQQNTRMSLQQPTTKNINELSAKGDTKYSNRISASRMSLNGPPPPPEVPEDFVSENPPSTASGIRLRKGSAGNAIRIHKGHNNSVDQQGGGSRGGSRHTVSKIPTSPRPTTSKNSAPPPPPPTSPPDNYKLLNPSSAIRSHEKDGEKRNSLSSPILLEHVVDKQNKALVYEDRATEALLSLSALASIPLSPSASARQEKKNAYHSEDDSDSSGGSSSSDDKVVLHHANRQSISSPQRDAVTTDNSSAGGSRLLGRALSLVTAHKHAIAEMVEVMKQEMELVQNMEEMDDRDSEAYAQDLENVLRLKKNSVSVLREELQKFQKFRALQLEQAGA